MLERLKGIGIGYGDGNGYGKGNGNGYKKSDPYTLDTIDLLTRLAASQQVTHA
jgi:hypothetical protein